MLVTVSGTNKRYLIETFSFLPYFRFGHAELLNFDLVSDFEILVLR